MAVIALASSRGAPGVTTSALVLTQLWHRRALLAECDVATGSSVMAGYFAAKVAQDRGLMPLAAAHRAGVLREELVTQTLEITDGRYLLPGLNRAGQAVNLTGFWGALSTELASLERGGMDVIVDAGRIGAEHGPVPMLRTADLTLLVTRSSLSGVAAWMTRLEQLREQIPEAFNLGAVGILVVGPDHPNSAKKISQALALPVIATLALDPVTAEVFSDGSKPRRHFESSPLIASGHAAVSAITQAVARRREQILAPTGGHTPGDPYQEHSNV